MRDSHLVLMDVDMLALNLKGLPEALRREVLQPAFHEVSKDYLDLTEDPEETGEWNTSKHHTSTKNAIEVMRELVEM